MRLMIISGEASGDLHGSGVVKELKKLNKDMDIFITLDEGTADLTNHIYHYNVKLTIRAWERITYVFDLEAEKRRLEYEEKINSQIKNSLHNVLKRISDFR